MIDDNKTLELLLAKEEIRNLALLYSRAVDRKDLALLRTLYTSEGWDSHAPYFEGPVDAYIDFLAASLDTVRVGCHFVCNHLISVEGATGEGEVYAIGAHDLSDGEGGIVRDLMGLRYIDKYALEAGRWRFARRTLVVDFPRIAGSGERRDPYADIGDDPSYGLAAALFARGPRT